MLEQAEVRVGPQGRVVIPAKLRHTLGLESGAILIARIEEGRLVLEKRESVITRLRSRFAIVQKGVSLASELIAERREAALKENSDD